MNKARRKNLKVILARMDELTAVIEEVKEDLQEVLDEEEEALGNLPESIQEGELGQKMQGYVDILEEVIDSLGELDSYDLYQKIEGVVEEQ